MCGICGKLMFDRNAAVSPALIGKMLDTIHHRGPDDEGIYVSLHIGLGHRRLSIIGLGTGHQPLCNEAGTVWITFNGEIYNYLDLKSDLVSKGHIFATETDTEVIVHLYEELGERCVDQLRGMFAFALWDDRQQVLFLARDRVGIKPLYYRLTDTSLSFASEIKALLCDPELKPEVLPDVVDRFLKFHYVPGEETLFKDIYKLAPGSYLLVKHGRTQIHQYWDLNFEPSLLSRKEAEAQLLELLSDSVRSHMMSDVPVGVLLSGGVDSSAMLGLATAHSDRPLCSFTIGFSQKDVVDERPYARLAARAHQSKHYEISMSAKDFGAFLPQYVWHMEEPVCEPPAIALYYVSKLAKDYVKVLISGEGSDEAFAGYQNYRSLLWLERLKAVLGTFSKPVSRAALAVNRFAGIGKISKYAPLLNVPLECYYYGRTSSPFSYIHNHVGELYSAEFADLVSDEASVAPTRRYFAKPVKGGSLSQMLYVDTKTWLPDDLLLKADKMTMANSVELRVPMLDHKILEFAASLPAHYKIRGWTTKAILKKTMNQLVPREILQRRKVGFPVPYVSWLRTELRDWVYDILFDSTTLARGYFKRESVEQLVAQYMRGGEFSKEIFSLVTLELCHRAFLGEQKAPMTESSRQYVSQM